MNMYTGESVWPSSDGVPTPFSCGVGLGRIQRFAGQTRLPYPVLAHIQVCAELIEPQYRVHAFLHDMPEVCCSDVPTPWKTSAAKKYEKKLLRRFYKAYGIKMPDDAAQAAVDHVDAVCLAAEANVLKHSAAKEVWPTFDEKAARLTRKYQKLWLEYMEPSYSGTLFTSLFETYLEQHKNALLIAA